MKAVAPGTPADGLCSFWEPDAENIIVWDYPAAIHRAPVQWSIDAATGWLSADGLVASTSDCAPGICPPETYVSGVDASLIGTVSVAARCAWDGTDGGALSCHIPAGVDYVRYVLKFLGTGGVGTDGQPALRLHTAEPDAGVALKAVYSLEECGALEPSSP
jgi:hypothetical protein